MDAGSLSRRQKHPRPVGRPAGEKGTTPANPVDGRAEDLPPGWVRVASRSKPGAFFYAHPATKRTQVQKPVLGPERPPRHHTPDAPAALKPRPHAGSERPPRHQTPDAPAALKPRPHAGSATPSAAGAVVDLEAEVDPAAEKAAAAERRRSEKVARKRKAEEEAEAEAVRKQQAQEEAEAEDVARQEALQKARERRARAAQAERTAEVDTPEEQRQEPPSSAALAGVSGGKPRRAGVRAGTLGGREVKKRRGAWRGDVSDDDVEGVTQEDLERWKQENDWRETSTEDQRSADSESERREADWQREPVPDPEQIFEPCLDVLKSGLWVERHPLVGPKKQWMLGRAAGQVDIPLQHESISRQHATVISQADQLFVADMGSAHGTLLDGRRLLTNTLVQLQSGAQLRFGASTRLYVFHEP